MAPKTDWEASNSDGINLAANPSSASDTQISTVRLRPPWQIPHIFSVDPKCELKLSHPIDLCNVSGMLIAALSQNSIA